VHDNHWTRWGQANRWPLVKDMPWREVEQSRSEAAQRRGQA
jgi:hypothetical protein